MHALTYGETLKADDARQVDSDAPGIPLAPVRPGSLLFEAPPEVPAPSRFGLGRLLSLPGRHWRTRAALRAELNQARRRLATLEGEIAIQTAARQDMSDAHAAELARLQAEADDLLAHTRRDAETALDVLKVELEVRSTERVESAVRTAQEDASRTAADVAGQHAAALAALGSELERAEAKAAQMENDLPVRVEAVRREAKTAQDAEVWALKMQAATQLETARQETAAALAAQAAALEARAAADIATAVRTFQREAADALAETVTQHTAALATLRAQLQDAETQRLRLEQELPAEVDRVRREEKATHAAHVALLEERADAQLAATRRDAETALAILGTELDAKASAHLEATLRAARDEAARAAAAVAQQHATALAAMKARLEDVEARRVRLEHDLPAQIAAARGEAAAAHATEVAALRTHAATQVETAVRDARDEATLAAAETARRHEAALAILRAERDEQESQRARFEQHLTMEAARRREMSLAHLADVAALQTRADAQLEAALREVQAQAARAAADRETRHEAVIAAMRVDLDATEARRAKLEHELPAHINAARREAAAAHAAEVAVLRTQATTHVEVAVREVRDEAARTAADLAVRHAAALVALRHELEEAEARRARLDQDLAVHVVLRREASIAHGVELAALQTQAAADIESAVAGAREEAARAQAEGDARHAMLVRAMQADLEASQAQRATLEEQLPLRVDAARREADAAHSTALAALRVHAAAQVESAVREARDEAARAGDAASHRHDAVVATDRDEERALPVARRESSARQMAAVTGGVVLAGFAGSLLGWWVAFWGVLD